MKKFIYKILILNILFLLFIGMNCNKSYAKFVIENRSKDIIKIGKADNIAPYILGRNVDIDYETFTEDKSIDFNDNIGISSSKYWYNPENRDFSGERY